MITLIFVTYDYVVCGQKLKSDKFCFCTFPNLTNDFPTEVTSEIKVSKYSDQNNTYSTDNCRSDHLKMVRCFNKHRQLPALKESLIF